MGHTEMPNIPKTPPSVIAQIAQLKTMSIAEIKSLWQELFNSKPPTHIRAFLERRLAYRLQENAFKQTSPEIIANNNQRIQNIIALQEQAKQQAKQQSNINPVPGSVLTRIYQDVEHQVTVTHDNKYQFEGRTYRSLSAIAREITGTQWSGPLFFGLRKSTNHKKSKKRS